MLYGGLKPRLPLLDEDAVLVEFQFRRRMTPIPGDDWETQTRPAAVSISLDLIRDRVHRRLETDHFQHRGGFMLQTVGPGDGCLFFRGSAY